MLKFEGYIINDGPLRWIYEQRRFNINVIQPSNGTVIAPAQGVGGSTVTLSNTPNDGYAFDHYIVNGQPITGNTFTMPYDEVSVSAEFYARTYSISKTNPSGGTITVPSSAVYGSTVTISISTTADWELNYFTVDGVQISGNTFTMPSHNVTVSAVLKAATRTYRSKFYEITSTTTYWGQYDLFAANNTNGNQYVNLYVWNGSAWQSWSSYRFQYLDCNNVSASPLVLTNNGSSHNTATLTAKNNNNQRNTFYIKFEWSADHDIGLTFNNFHVASGSYTTGLVVKRAEGNNYDWNGGIYQSDSNYHDLMQWTDILSTGGGLVPYKKV